jgi:hypothetical protein
VAAKVIAQPALNAATPKMINGSLPREICMCIPNPTGGTLTNSHQGRLKVARCICASIELHSLQVLVLALSN